MKEPVVNDRDFSIPESVIWALINKYETIKNDDQATVTKYSGLGFCLSGLEGRIRVLDSVITDLYKVLNR